MLKAKYHPLGKLFWEWYTHRIIKSDFHTVHWNLNSFEPAKDKSLLVLANHCSWWDGFWVYELNRLFLKKHYHVMMLEQQLKKHQLLRYAGAYSINREGPRSMMESLQYTNQLLEQPENMVLMFPQGRIESIYNQRPTFEKGAWRIIQKAKKPMQIVYCINTIDYMEHKKPSLTVSLSEGKTPNNVQQLQDEFMKAYKEARAEQESLFT